MKTSIKLSYHSIASGSDNVDYNFPFIEFSQETQRYLITYNDGDISAVNLGVLSGVSYMMMQEMLFFCPTLELSELLQKQ